jgi:hypothetical protein
MRLITFVGVALSALQFSRKTPERDSRPPIFGIV